MAGFAGNGRLAAASSVGYSWLAGGATAVGQWAYCWLAATPLFWLSPSAKNSRWRERNEGGGRFRGQHELAGGDDLAADLLGERLFCPRYFDHIVDVAYLPTPERRRQRRRRIIIWTVIYLLLVTMAILMALFGQRRL